MRLYDQGTITPFLQGAYIRYSTDKYQVCHNRDGIQSTNIDSSTRGKIVKT